METITITMILEIDPDNLWYCEQEYGGKSFFGYGATIEECKLWAEISLQELINSGDIPPGDYRLVFEYNTECLLEYYKDILASSAIERLIKINHKRLYAYYDYASEHEETPCPQHLQEIETALHDLGIELLSIRLKHHL